MRMYIERKDECVFIRNKLMINTRFTDVDYISFFTEICLFDGYIKMQFFVNYLFKIYRFLFTIVFNTFFISKLYLGCIFSAYTC